MEIFNIIVKSHKCPNHFYDEGFFYCVHENGPKYCNEDDCPIRQPPKKQLQADACKCPQGSLCDFFGKDENCRYGDI